MGLMDNFAAVIIPYVGLSFAWSIFLVKNFLEDFPKDLIEAAESCGLDERTIRQVLYELPQGKGSRRRATGPCPLSGRELDVLRRRCRSIRHGGDS